ncbi:MAG TPA: citrate synthase [Phototrophicaceae bacterium]|nr:citrate synthase [Phototrophicaceae bacterium]
MENAKLTLNGREYEFPVISGSEDEVGIDFTTLRAKTKAIAFDPGYGNTGACQSAVTYIDGEQGILRYRGYPIEQIATLGSFTEVAFLLINGELPHHDQLRDFERELTYHTLLHEDTKKAFDSYPATAHPMAILASMVISLAGYYEENDEPETIHLNMMRLLAKLPTMAAWSYKHSIGQPYVYPRNDLSYTSNFLNMMFAVPTQPYHVPDVLERALNLLLILHADHEQNCSTSTVRMVGSSRAGLFASVGSGVCALSGPLHGGANQEVIEMLEMIDNDGGNYRKYVDLAKDKNSDFRLMGFGHRVYRNFDPRATILKKSADEVLDALGVHDQLLDIAKNLEEIALKDEYFIERKLYPNVDFYSGILYRAMGIPTNMFTVMFAIGRLPGWIAQWQEMRGDRDTKIARPRQVYTGEQERQYVPIFQR